ncbi:hypothetical protein AVEN_92153-1 [Araneus ventricosus]|uniref:Uncharacterized protein n=1 Tax=Araneus ventricosus TaxID=182803 RepID=A0A4Y2GAR4_ARAVE|nr:hypothetical protein AVEN_92153-1 [Araneus ventricosus]
MLDTDFFFGPILGAVLVVLSTVLFYWYSIQNHDFWEKKKIPHAKPLPFVGTLLSYVRKPIHEVDMERYKKFGRIFGMGQTLFSPLFHSGHPPKCPLDRIFTVKCEFGRKYVPRFSATDCEPSYPNCVLFWDTSVQSSLVTQKYHKPHED